MYAEVLIEYPSKKIDKTFTYIVPIELRKELKKGMQVSISFNNKIINGFVCNIKNDYDGEHELKNIIAIKNKEIIFDQELDYIANFIHKKTLAPLISCYQAMLPTALKIKNVNNNYKLYDKYLLLNEDENIIKDYINTFTNRKSQISLLKDLLINKKILRNKYSTNIVKILLEKGLIKEIHLEKYRINKEEKEIYKHTLNNDQKKAINEIMSVYNENNVFLIEGITGCGKTEIYLHLLEKIIKQSKTALVLVPEISLTMQIVKRFYEWFGSSVAIFHSALSAGEKHDEYMKIIRNEVSVVVGTRSAIFTPLKNIGLIIIDECHSDTYKQDSTPKYNAIDIAIIRSKYNNCPLIMGSATPLLEQKARALKGVYKHIRINKRANNMIMPIINLIDMSLEIKKGNYILSEELIKQIKKRLENEEQIILLLNRRGYSTIINCSNCGYAFKCPNCDITLTYHLSSNNLRCHYCGYTIVKPCKCPECNEDALNFLGLGTEKVETELNKLFKSAKIIRMDQDTTTKKGSHEQIITDFKNHNYDILLGTQMISKGLDFPLVTLVGVINADSSLNLPDFRSNERTFSLLTQVSGRAGRSEKKGLVLLQTYNIDNAILNYVKNNDYDGFYKYEMELRRKLKYPPYYYMISLKIISKIYEDALKNSIEIVKYLKRELTDDCIILGPSTHNLFKFNNHYRFVIVIKYKTGDNVNRILRNLDVEYLYHKTVDIDIDVDPLYI